MKLDQANRENSMLHSDIDVFKHEKEHLSKYIRELEQKNDDLERAQRVVAETVGAIEMSLNSALERNAILEIEVDEKECLKEKLQRLADETRGILTSFRLNIFLIFNLIILDLKQELQVREKGKLPDNERGLNGHAVTHSIDSNILKIENDPQTPTKRNYYI